MTLFTKTGTIVKDTTTGAHTQNFTSELGFTPKAIIFWTTMKTATGITADSNMMIGFTNDTNDMVVSLTDDDAAANSTTNTITAPASCIELQANGSGTSLGRATCAFGANGFDLVWDANADNQAYRINYFAMGGTNITNVAVQKIDIAGTGDQTYTTTGSFQGDLAFFLTLSGTNNATAGNGFLSFGAAKSSSQQFCTSFSIDGGLAAADTHKTQRTDMCGRALSAAGTDLTTSAFVAWTATGFTLNHAVADATDDIICMIIQGGVSEIGSFNQATGNGVQTINLTDSTLDPSILLLSSFGTTSTTSIVDHANMSLGCSDATSEVCTWIGNEDAAPNMISKSDQSETKTMRLIDEIVGGGTLLAEADIDSLSTTGRFSLNWTTTDATARQICYVVLGETGAAAGADTGPGIGTRKYVNTLTAQLPVVDDLYLRQSIKTFA